MWRRERPSHRPHALSAGPTVLAAIVALVACGGAPGADSVDPRTLVERRHHEETAPDALPDDAAAAEALLVDVVRQLGADTCGVRRLVALGALPPDSDPEGRIARLDRLARTLCDAGVRRLDTSWAADATVAIDLGSSARLSRGDTVVVVEGFERTVRQGTAAPLASAPESQPVGTQSACGGVVTERPDLIVFAELDRPADLTIESAGQGFARLRGHGGGDTCANFSADRVASFAIDADASPYLLWVGTDGEALDWTAELAARRAASTSNVIWRPGVRLDFDVSVGPHSAAAPSDAYSYCSGYIAGEPTVRLVVPEDAYGTIWVESSSDPVLYVRGPYGEVLCNDDYNGVDPLVDGWFSAGEWEIFVGSFSPGATFGAELFVE